MQLRKRQPELLDEPLIERAVVTMLFRSFRFGELAVQAVRTSELVPEGTGADKAAVTDEEAQPAFVFDIY